MNTIEDKILSLVKLADPSDPVNYTRSIIKEFALEKFNDCIQSCNKCQISNLGFKSIGYGDISSPVLILNESISEEQYNNGSEINLPLLDSDGEVFDKALSVMGANKNMAYTINCVNCYPAKCNNNVIVKRIPSVEERTACTGYIDKIIDIIKPAVIIALGSVASNALSDNKVAIIQDRGKMFKYKDCQVMPTFHPNFFKESLLDESMINDYKKNFVEDLFTAFMVAKELRPNCNIGELKLPFN